VYPFEALGSRELGFAFAKLMCASTSADGGNVHLKKQKQKKEMSHGKEMWWVGHLEHHIALIGLNLQLANLKRISESTESKCVTTHLAHPAHGLR
jgi:hypothetical protein